LKKARAPFDSRRQIVFMAMAAANLTPVDIKALWFEMGDDRILSQRHGGRH
jgi:hypothetical protein